MKSNDQLFKEFKKEMFGLEDHSNDVQNHSKFKSFSKKEELLLTEVMKIVEDARNKLLTNLSKEAEGLQRKKIELAISDIQFMKEIHNKINA